MENRDILIKKINILLETSSDEQIAMIDKLINLAIEFAKWDELQHEESKNFTSSDVPNAGEDVEEGNWGTLYRGVDNN